MKGCRPLSDREIELVVQSFRGRYARRDKALFILGCRTGFRISELLSLRIRDVRQAGQMVDAVYVQRSAMKGRREGRCVPLHAEAKAAIQDWLRELEGVSEDSPLFRSRNGQDAPLTRFQAHRIFKDAFRRAGLTGKLASHCCRKSFAARLYGKLNGDLVKLQRALAHKSIASTAQYLSFRQDEIDAAILGN